MRRMLISATVPRHIETFHLPLVKTMAKHGWIVDTVSDGPVNDPSVTTSHVVDWTRKPLSLKNIRAARQLRQILEREPYDLVYCHTPVAAAITRIITRKARRKGTRVAYMGHGFHFFNGAPASYWMTYFPAEWLLAYLTDDILTINREDYSRARRWFRTNVHRTRGVGINLERFHISSSEGPSNLRAETGIDAESRMIMFVGELSRRKNQELLIRALSKVLEGGFQADLVLVGDGPARDTLTDLAERLAVLDRVHFLGRRNDVPELLAGVDLVASASVHEGLPQNVVEAMAMGRPVLASPIRGHVDLIEHGTNGFLAQSFNPNEWALAIRTILSMPEYAARVGEQAVKRAKDFEVSKAVERVVSILDT